MYVVSVCRKITCDYQYKARTNDDIRWPLCAYNLVRNFSVETSNGTSNANPHQYIHSTYSEVRSQTHIRIHIRIHIHKHTTMVCIHTHRKYTCTRATYMKTLGPICIAHPYARHAKTKQIFNDNNIPCRTQRRRTIHFDTHTYMHMHTHTHSNVRKFLTLVSLSLSLLPMSLL